jgi:ABC transporter substrate binding protein (PQQ-dependent alcohol dehydrogenase system)
MTSRVLWLGLALLGLATAGSPARAQHPGVVTIGYVELENDARYEPVLGTERIVIARRERPEPAAEVALDEAVAIGRVIQRDFVLAHFRAANEQLLIEQVVAAVERHDIHLFVLDLPAETVGRLATALNGKPALLFNATAPDDSLRRALCAPNLIHTMPSLAMLTDALAQHLVAHKWRDVLLLEGPQESDKILADAFARSAAKFGARLIERRGFKLGNDPRERDDNNVALLTATGRDYDVVFVADSDGEFARGLPYRTTRPRPVIGSTGLVAAAWHWTWDRYGAPQLINRFLARTNRHMTGLDWSVWIAVKMIVQASLRTRGGDYPAQAAHLLGDAAYDGVKGLAVSLRPWDHQLRQAILLSTQDSVIAAAPLPGFLHATNELDTLGDDRRDTPCRLDGGAK